MFDLKNIDFIKTDEQHGRRHYSFVGIRRKRDSDRLEFWLPLGFDEFNHNDYNEVKKFFFRIYKTFKIYITRKSNIYLANSMTNDRDGVYEEEGGFSFTNQNNIQSIFYGKLNSIDKIIEGYDELRILSLVRKDIYSTDINYSKIHRYMHQAVYLENDIIYLDEMNIAKNLVIPESPLIVQLFCFIYTEIKRELQETDSIPSKAIELGGIFKDLYLQPSSNLFEEDNFSNTLTVLRDTLHYTDKVTLYKDEDFWHFYDAIEAFLYGEKNNDTDGVLWGINNFYDLWEDMCQTFMQENESVLFADIKGKLKNYKNISPNPFAVSLNCLTGRHLRPDLVLELKVRMDDILNIKKQKKGKEDIYLVDIDGQDNLRKKYPSIFKAFLSLSSMEKNWRTGAIAYYFTKQKLSSFRKIFEAHLLDESNNQSRNLLIIDFKYMKELDYNLYNPLSVDEKGHNKIKHDVQKQLIYEWSLKKNLNCDRIFSEFWICYYSEHINPDNFKKLVNVNNKFFNDSKINVYKLNFNALQGYYNHFYSL